MYAQWILGIEPKQEVEVGSDRVKFRLLKMEISERVTRFSSYRGW